MVAFGIFRFLLLLHRATETVLTCYFLAGTFGSTLLAVIGGIYVDFMKPIKADAVTLLFTGVIVVGAVANQPGCSHLSQYALLALVT